MGRSKAQDELFDRIADMYPDSSVSDEVYIGDLISERGYTQKEIEAELGHRMHKQFVDIVLRDSDRTVAFEYHGEQHYSLVSNMTKTSADLLAYQQLDREKSWILSRIGVPLVAVPFDAYIDPSVLEEMIEASYGDVESLYAELTECAGCGRAFPSSQLPFGVCSRCQAEEEAAAEADRQATQSEYDEERRERVRSRKTGETKEERKERLAAERSERKERYRQYKQTPEYQRRKAEEKERRRAYAKEQRERRKREQRRG